jgi:hypothetical protein
MENKVQLDKDVYKLSRMIEMDAPVFILKKGIDNVKQHLMTSNQTKHEIDDILREAQKLVDEFEGDKYEYATQYLFYEISLEIVRTGVVDREFYDDMIMYGEKAVLKNPKFKHQFENFKTLIPHYVKCYEEEQANA